MSAQSASWDALDREVVTCRRYLERELDLLSGPRVVVALGAFAFSSLLRLLRDRGLPIGRPLPRFRHGQVVLLPDATRALIASRRPPSYPGAPS